MMGLEKPEDKKAWNFLCRSGWPQTLLLTQLQVLALQVCTIQAGKVFLRKTPQFWIFFHLFPSNLSLTSIVLVVFYCVIFFLPRFLEAGEGKGKKEEGGIGSTLTRMKLQSCRQPALFSIRASSMSAKIYLQKENEIVPFLCQGWQTSVVEEFPALRKDWLYCYSHLLL
jgi:hypothetical protein